MLDEKIQIENEIINELRRIQQLLRIYGADDSSLSMYISDTCIRANNPYWETEVKPINVTYFSDTGETIHHDSNY